jgi:LPLT family lysophospholipid transporter-like MFS transporter
LHTVNRALPAGILIGALILAFAHVNSLPAAILMLVITGACGGFYVVPLNALLQERGHESVGAGHAIAVQNFFENFCMLLMIGFYTIMAKSGASVIASTTAVGLLVFVCITLLAYLRVSRGNN